MNWKNIGLLMLLACLWGPSFLFIKVAVEYFPPLTLALVRVAIGALFLLAVLRWQRKQLPRDRRVWQSLAVVAFAHNALPFVLFGWGEQYIDSALAAILNGTTPLFTIVLAHMLVKGDQLTPAKLIGALVGFTGLLVLTLPMFLDGVQGTTLGILAVMVASASYAFAMVYARNHLRGLPPLIAPASQLMIATLYLFPLAMIFNRPWQLPTPSTAAVASLFALGILGTGVAFVVYYRLMETAEPSYVAMVTYVIPVIGVLLGVLVLGESLTWFTVAGFALILLGVMIVNGLLANRLPARRPPLSEPGD